MARDKFHQAVRVALEKAGWQITHDPFSFEFGKTDFEIDLGAESLIAAERETEYIAVEVKGFLSKSALFDFHLALGQFLNYRFALEQTDPNRKLFLAIPEDAYFDFFQRPFVQKILVHHGVALIVYNPQSEVILLWL
jgi:XisH protein